MSEPSVVTSTEPAATRPWLLRGWGLAILAAVVYTALMTVNWLVTPYDYTTETAALVRASIPLLVVMVLVMLLLVRLTGVRVQGRGGRLDAIAWIGTILILLGSLQLVVSLLGGTAGVDWPLVGAVLVGCLLIGFGEELAYRGLALGGLGQVVSVPVAVVLSALLFSALHSINVLAGQSVGQTGFQLFYTFFMGLALGWIYIGSGRNLVLVALLHGLWDFQGIATALLPSPVYFSAIPGIALWVLGIVATVIGFRRYRGVRLDDLV